MPRAIHIAQDILPIGDFKVRAGKILRGLKDNGRSVVITQHGRPAGVLVSPDEYDRLRERERFLDSIQTGLADVEAGRGVSDEELGTRLDEVLGPLE